MPEEFLGALVGSNQLRPGPPAPGTSLNLELDFLRDLAVARERAELDRVLMLGGEPLVATQFAASHTTTLGFMIPYRPGLTTPQQGAKQLAALDHVTNGRIRAYAITGITAERGNGDFVTDKDERYAAPVSISIFCAARGLPTSRSITTANIIS